jgi:hypothetical protein
MSDKEYNVITSCVSTNLSETPNLPPSFRENVNRTKESIRLLADKVNLNNNLLLSRTVIIMTVNVQYALLELHNGSDAESPLAELAVSISYKLCNLFCLGNDYCDTSSYLSHPVSHFSSSFYAIYFVLILIACCLLSYISFSAAGRFMGFL